MAAAQTMAMTTTQKIIAIAVTIIIISTVALPVIDDARENGNVDFVNTGFYFSKLVSGSSTHTIVQSSGTYTIDGEELEYSGSAGIIAVQTDTLNIRIVSSGANISISYWDVNNSTLVSKGSITASTITVNPSTKTVSITDITASTTIDDFSVSYSDYCYIVSNSGEYKAVFMPTMSGQVMYIDDIDNITAVYSNSSSPYWISVSGSHVFAPTLTNASLSVELSDVEGYSGVHSFELTNSTATSDLVIKSGSSSYSPLCVILPASVEGTDKSTESWNNLIGIIPIMLILVPLMLAVRMIALRRN